MKIIGVAILSHGITYWMREPARHGVVGWAMIEHGYPKPFPGGPAQGFMLEDEVTFVDRIRAAQIALASGQVKELISPPNLYSEDLW